MTSQSCSRVRSPTEARRRASSARCAGSIRMPSGPFSSDGATGAFAGPGRRSSRRSSTGKVDHYVVRPVAPHGRALPPGDHDVPARVGRGAAHRAVCDPRDRRLLVGAGGRAADASRTMRVPARVLPRRLRGGTTAAGGIRPWHRVARGGPAGRRPARQPDRRRAHARDGLRNRARRYGRRPSDRRRRARGAVGCRLRRLRGAQDDGRRHARHRRPGTVELADPQLPRVSRVASAEPCSPARRTSRRGCSGPDSCSCRR